MYINEPGEDGDDILEKLDQLGQDMNNLNLKIGQLSVVDELQEEFCRPPTGNYVINVHQNLMNRYK